MFRLAWEFYCLSKIIAHFKLSQFGRQFLQKNTWTATILTSDLDKAQTHNSREAASSFFSGLREKDKDTNTDFLRLFIVHDDNNDKVKRGTGE